VLPLNLKRPSGAPKSGAPSVISDAKPLDCYRVLLCETAVNSDQRLMTFVGVAEQFALPDELFGQLFPMQAHFALAGSGSYEVRVVWVATDAFNIETGDISQACDTPDALTFTGRFRFSMPGVRLPIRPGTWSLQLEWRYKGEEAWQRSTGKCPVIVLRAASKDAPAASPSKA
jgi:hypothetical protein